MCPLKLPPPVYLLPVYPYRGFFASTSFLLHWKEGNKWYWHSSRDLQSTCFAWFTFILNLNIQFGFPGMLVLRHPQKGPAIPRHSGIRSQMTWHRESSKVLVQWLLHLRLHTVSTTQHISQILSHVRLSSLPLTRWVFLHWRFLSTSDPGKIPSSHLNAFAHLGFI